jgi:DNA-binding beta-propeller fold protein YncE
MPPRLLRPAESKRSTGTLLSFKVRRMGRAAPVVFGLALLSAGIGAACVGGGAKYTITSDAGSDSHVDAGKKPDAPYTGPLEGSPPPVIPREKQVDATSTPVVFDALRGGVWTANGDIGSVSYVDIDLGGQKLVQEIPVATGGDIRSVALSPDFAWLAAVDRNNAQVALIDPYDRQVRRLVPTGTHPRAAVWDAANPRWLYVALEDADAVGIIDRTLGEYVGTVSVGRIPSGLAVSRLRPDLYVTHRIDGLVTTLAIAYGSGPPSLAVTGNVIIADSPPESDPTVPQGKPFSFEGMAWTADGNFMWVPFELFAPTHPFQFTETVFPAISVLDFTSGGGLEVQTNPYDPNGVMAGRKLLFGAIDLEDAEGNTQIVSDPCAVATHPNGNVAYALACASEDFLVFDITSGIAVQLVRNQPGPATPLGDHPVGLALDVAGERAFVLSDQSHTLSTLDLAEGDITEEVTQIAGPLSVITKDTVDPNLRAGLELFFNANAGKMAAPFTLNTSGNDWLSCGGCHLDGFVSTNKRLFEVTHAVNPAVDAQIGHVGLRDLFASAPDFTSPSFDPHDILVALTDQGGLCSDRTGQACLTTPVDISTATSTETTMAAQIARVIARDLPVGPTWLLSPEGAPDESYDKAWCGKCHAEEYAAWQQSAHAHSAIDEMVTFCDTTEQAASTQPFGKLCAGCHDPVNVRLGITTLQKGLSITCLGCHDTVRTIRAGGNGDLQMDVHQWTEDHKASASAGLVTLRNPDFCGGCHQQFVPGTGVPAIQTLQVWQNGPYGSPTTGPQTLCIDCHMPQKAGVADHRFPGGNVYLANHYGNGVLAMEETANLQAAFSLKAATQTDGSVTVTITNNDHVGSGHDFPTGVTDIREPWVELQAVDGTGTVVQTYGGPDSTGLLPSNAARLGVDIAEADGTILLEHQLSLATRIPFDVRVPPDGSIQVSIPASVVPASLPSGATKLDAVLQYHNIRTTYYRAATGNSTESVTPVEITRTPVSGMP